VKIPRSPLLKILFPIALVLIGTVGYWLIEGWSLFDGLYMTVITLSTIGYGETHPLHPGGRVFTILLILGGVFTFAYVISDFVRSVVTGELRAFWSRQQMEQQLRQLHNHIIVCGYGRVGRLVCREFCREGVAFVVIDESAEALQDFNLEHGIALTGDCSSDETLKHAGIESARGLIAAMQSDADNLFTTMSARLLNPKLFIVARVEEVHSEQKLLRGGANRVVSPYEIGGNRVAQAMLRPTVVDFIELATRTEHIELQMEEARIHEGSALAGRTLRDSHVRRELRVIVVAIKKHAGKMQFNPEADTMLEAGDILVAMGSREQLAQLELMARPAARST
jgi:voltage-gated potassium channel